MLRELLNEIPQANWMSIDCGKLNDDNEKAELQFALCKLWIEFHKENWENLQSKTHGRLDDRAALLLDATKFVNHYPNACDICEIDPKFLVEYMDGKLEW